MALFLHTLTRLRHTLVDDGRGGKKLSATFAVTSLPGWTVDTGITESDLRNRDASKIAYTARGPVDVDLDPLTDRVVYDAKTYEIDGAVLRQPGVSARTSHCIILLKRWEG